jgi:hydrogenase nickel incorporation protein HypA/HybF
MHEMSLALSLIELADGEAARYAPARITSLHVRIGALAAVVPDALRFSFGVASSGTPLEHAQLVIEEVAGIVACDRCGAESPIEAGLCACPQCGGPGRVIAGLELELTALEVQDA